MIHKAKKSLGQNFLKSKQALNTMCTSGDVNEKDIILEIGPGKGALTTLILEKVQKVIAIEKDRDLVEFLKEKFSEEIKFGKLELLEEDILDFKIHPDFCKQKLPLNEGNKSYKIIANIPYNITGAIIKKFLSGNFQPEKMVLLVQKEVAERIVARDGKESILSISVKAYGEPKYILKVSKRFFSPSPKVDSAIVAINNISKKNFKDLDESKFFEIVKTGFAHKRKVLIKNLESISSSPNQNLNSPSPLQGEGVGGEVVGEGRGEVRKNLENIFEKLNIDKKARAETISVEKWLKIATLMSLQK